ncbi:hypothetical protein GBAR_LOCUS4302 [Geodia barretti]|uniref:Uncharacterized protein n=1 Tax=Geodia barretti TaxID=519541 RepID=A0AA35R6R5_GEOBA|nr:hypothetical protein GBAR_LOCUS4302 [Geodia barretti]
MSHMMQPDHEATPPPPLVHGLSPPRLGHTPFFRPACGVPDPHIHAPPRAPYGNEPGPPPPLQHHPNSNYPHNHPGPPPPGENSSSSAAGTNGGNGGGPPQNFPNPLSSGGPPSHSYSAFRNNLRTNPPPMSYSAKRLQQQQQSTVYHPSDKEPGDGSPPEGEKVETNEEAPLIEANQDSVSSTTSRRILLDVPQSHRSVREEGGHRERGKERRGRSRSRSHSRERDGRSGKSVRYVRKEDKTKKKRSPSPSFEEDFGVSKETLLHGSYADYIKEYSARSGRAGGGSGQSSSHQPHQTPAMLANLAAAYQKALNQFTTKLAQQDPSKMPPMDPKTYSRLVEEFLSKTQGTKSSHR